MFYLKLKRPQTSQVLQTVKHDFVADSHLKTREELISQFLVHLSGIAERLTSSSTSCRSMIHMQEMTETALLLLRIHVIEGILNTSDCMGLETEMSI